MKTRPGTHPNRGIRGSLAERLWARVDRRGTDECWLWTGPLDRDRGRLTMGGRGGRLVRSHQAAWIVTNGPVPPGMVIRHRCDVGACCNPGHLELGTRADNNRDMAERGQLNTEGMTFGSSPKTTPEQAVEIRHLLATGMSQRVVGKRFGISQKAVSRIHRGEVHS